MNKEDLLKLAAEFIENEPGNFIGQEIALSPAIAGMRIYEPPIMAAVAADDKNFLFLRDPKVIGEHFTLPKEWLPEAQSVFSFFLPFTERVRQSNARDMSSPSKEWLHARIEGQALLAKLANFLQSEIEKQGFQAVAPALDQRFKATGSTDASLSLLQGVSSPFSSNWSERHVAFVCGLGTVGLSQGIITQKGMAGRLGSLVTSLALEEDKRNYSEPYEYCTKCASCAQNCPVQAISPETGKNHAICSAFLEQIKKDNYPRYGCGKCQVNVPCEGGIP